MIGPMSTVMSTSLREVSLTNDALLYSVFRLDSPLNYRGKKPKWFITTTPLINQFHFIEQHCLIRSSLDSSTSISFGDFRLYILESENLERSVFKLCTPSFGKNEIPKTRHAELFNSMFNQLRESSFLSPSSSSTTGEYGSLAIAPHDSRSSHAA